MDKVIDLNQWRQKKEIADKSTPIPGVIVWLHCPNCQSTEYSELQVPGGRIHKCGMLVEEAEVAIDVRAEYTISQRNLVILEKLSEKMSGIKNKLIRKWIRNAQMLEQIKENEREFQQPFRNDSQRKDDSLFGRMGSIGKWYRDRKRPADRYLDYECPTS